MYTHNITSGQNDRKAQNYTYQGQRKNDRNRQNKYCTKHRPAGLPKKYST